MISLKGRLEHLHKPDECDCHVDGRIGGVGLRLYGPDEEGNPLDVLVVVCDETADQIVGAAAMVGENPWSGEQGTDGLTCPGCSLDLSFFSPSTAKKRREYRAFLASRRAETQQETARKVADEIEKNSGGRK